MGPNTYSEGIWKTREMKDLGIIQSRVKQRKLGACSDAPHFKHVSHFLVGEPTSSYWKGPIPHVFKK